MLNSPRNFPSAPNFRELKLIADLLPIDRSYYSHYSREQLDPDSLPIPTLCPEQKLWMRALIDAILDYSRPPNHPLHPPAAHYLLHDNRPPNHPGSLAFICYHLNINLPRLRYLLTSKPIILNINLGGKKLSPLLDNPPHGNGCPKSHSHPLTT